MRKGKFNTEEKLKILAEWDSGSSVADLSRKHQVSPATLYKWRKETIEDQDEDKRRIKDLEAENSRLKKMYANLSMNHEILQEGYALIKKFQARDIKKK
ncbi:transposase [Aureispira anguillae]|uniref:Transposase n=1 Tax=Aureispira anguillae TaxID=2864201 RepID=A0A915YDC5_9BACT|nr:transposase [Aureispira anguillae]BDS09589.1 transposase [Aureispira anguillae]BDS10984.1 transposase [Aureispira anguillae]